MPTYEYRCKACGQDLEVVQAFTDDALTTCEACGGPLRKVFGNVGIAFKGSGFYKNDSRGKSSTTASGGDKGGDSSTSDAGSATKDAGAGTKKDATPATPSPAKAADKGGSTPSKPTSSSSSPAT